MGKYSTPPLSFTRSTNDSFLDRLFSGNESRNAYLLFEPAWFAIQNTQYF